MKWPRWNDLLPPPRSRLAPWGPEVFAVILLVTLIAASCFQAFLWTGLGEAIYGTEVMELVRSTRDSDEAKLARMRVSLPIGLVTLPLQLLAVVGFLRFTSDTRPYQLGLTTHRAGSNALLGVLGWLILTPIVLGVHFGVGLFYQYLDPAGVRSHGFDELSRSGKLTPIEYGMIVFEAMVSAPLREELLAHGVLLGWLVRQKEGSHAVMGLCVLLGTAASFMQWKELERQVLALVPLVFVLVLLAVYVWVCRRRTPVAAGVFASSLLFAMAHLAVWPSPVALFVLALGLGWLAWRTQSLVGPMVLHSLFNGVACVELLTK